MDVLSDVLRVVRLTGAIFFTARFSSPWSISSPPPDLLARALNSEAECLTLFHVLVEGQCWVGLENSAPYRMEAGDVVILPQGDVHIMSSRPDITPRPIGTLIPSFASDGIPNLHYGDGGAVTRFVCGYLECDQRFNPLIGALPPLFFVRPGRDGSWLGPDEKSSPGEPIVVHTAANDWLDRTLHYLAEEAMGERPGSPAMLTRLTEILFVEVVRRYTQQLPAEQTGWLAGVRDPEVGRALRLLHKQPGRNWTVDLLARETGLSRSALARRFTDLLGEPPILYLTGWRMQLAKRLLQEPALSIPQVAEEVGYTSEAAFNRAFKRCVGKPPGIWREALA
ncbi:MAG TPA: AraC family transcriptional regulator [Rhodothermales bacterium]|nr:AraC family transcriptional regulator [Rhodothermales bacterium]